MKTPHEETRPSSPQILAEDELKRMSRKVKDLLPTHEGDHDDTIRLIDVSETLFATASSPSLLATHQVAAWNTLCAFVDELSRSNSESTRSVLWHHGIWLRALDLYVNGSQHARPKSAKQLLATLGNALHKSDNPIGKQSHIAKCTGRYLLDDSSPRQAKAIVQLLTHFISKDLLDAGTLNGALRSGLEQCPDNNGDAGVVPLLRPLFRWANFEDFGSVAARCISVVLDKQQESSQRQETPAHQDPSALEPPVWSTPLDECLQNVSVNMDQLRIHIFPVLFKRSLPQYDKFLRTYGLERLGRGQNEQASARDRRLLLAALQSGKELGMVYESDSADLQNDGAVLYVPVKAYAALLSSEDGAIRITGLSLLIHSHSATRPFLLRSLQLLKRSLSMFFADTDANFRGEVFSLIQRLMDRLRAISAVLSRTADSSVRGCTPCMTLRHHREFIHWLLRFLTWELRPSASYQRHLSALKALSIMVRSGIDSGVPSACWSKSALSETKWPFNITILSDGLSSLLLDLLMDPFDDVRQTASLILSMYGRDQGTGASQNATNNLKRSIDRAEKIMLASGRADQADGVAHMYSLLARTERPRSIADSSDDLSWTGVLSGLIDDLQRMLQSAHTSLAAAAKRYPMHGILTSIRFSLAQQSSSLPEDARNKLVDCLHRVWETVKPVLCNDAPEGYELEDADDLAESSSKDILSYCWRALKESSLLLGTIAADKTLDDDVAMSLGNLCFAQLAELRHRGAFSTVAQTWVVCCNRAVALPQTSDARSLLGPWYHQAIDILRNKTTINTRRSAGIPSLLCGLLIADKSGQLLSSAFQDLSVIAKDTVDAASANESSLPQVHALNCIKDVLKNTRLGEQSERYVPSALHLAAESLRSEAWAIRNCGLMLFRGAIDRLLGTSEAHLEDDGLVHKRISGHQHLDLLEIVLRLLEVPASAPGAPNARFEGVFPALQMLQRMEIPAALQEQAQDAVLALTASPSWHVRDRAARTYATLSVSGGSLAALEDVLEARIGDENALHGALLCLKHLASTIIAQVNSPSRWSASTPRISEKVLGPIVEAFESAHSYQAEYKHPVTRAALVDALGAVMRLRHSASGDPPMSDHLDRNDALSVKFLAQLSGISGPSALKAAENAIERASLAKAFATQLALGQMGSRERLHALENASAVIVTLAEFDADACVEFWRTLRLRISSGYPEGVGTILVPAAAQILSGCFQMRVKCEVQRFALVRMDGDTAFDGLLEACERSSSPLAEDSNQAFTDQWLQLRALVLDDQLRRNDVVANDISLFISTCKAAMADDGFFSREAAALAVSRMVHFWPYILHQDDTLACDTYLIVYDLLNDDDEGLRLLAASTVSRVLRSANRQARNTHLEPITASQRLLSHMLTHLPTSRTFAREAFARAFSTDEAVVDQLHTFSQLNTALFAQEKQNLYIDPAREVRAWSQVLLRLPVNSIPKRLIHDLTFWVDEGLYTLTSRLGKGGRQGDNGALGWASKAETFVLGLQVVYGAEVLMGYVCKGGRLAMEGSEVVRRLVLFTQALGEKGEGCLLWRWEVERVLKEIVEGRVRLAWGLAGEVREAAKTTGA